MKIRSSFATAILMAFLALSQAACLAGVAAGAGVATGMTAAQERGLGGAVTDNRIRMQIGNLWMQEDERLYQNLSLQVHEGRVLIHGKVPEPEMRVEAVRIAWRADGVNEVINEIEVAEDGGGLGSYARDAWISTQLRNRLLWDTSISSINYSVVTVDGVVYLMGIARDQAELDRAVSHARNLARVQEVVSYVRVREPEGRERREEA